MARTFQQLQFDVQTRIQDGDGAGAGDMRWSLTEKQAAINHAYREFCAETAMVTDYVTFTQDSGAVYKQPSGTRIVRITSLQSATVGYELAPADPRRLFQWSTTWDTDTGTPEFYVWPYQMASGVKKLRIVPQPTSALTDLKAFCVVLPAELSANGDTPAIPEEYHDALAAGAVAYLLKKNGPAQDLERAVTFEQEYREAVARGTNAKTTGFSSVPLAIPYRYL